jgi:amino acid adenylation domain-containing protein
VLDEDTMARIMRQFTTFVSGIAADPDKRVAELPLLAREDLHQLLVEWNQTGKEYPRDSGIHDLFTAQAARTPDAVAVTFENEHLTYGELNRRANQLAHYLHKLGVGPEVLVGICVERSLDMVVGLLGILKAGGAYVPLDPAYPQERLAFMLTDARAPVLLTQQALLESLPQHTARTVCLDTDWKEIALESDENHVSGAGGNNLAYVIYTSGSTGKPKGVAIEHHSTVALLDWAKDIFPVQDLAGVLASTSICFDLSVYELFFTLSRVARSSSPGTRCTYSPCRQPRRHLINTVPSAIAELIRQDACRLGAHDQLAGEPLPDALVQQIFQQSAARQVFNLYGPSEDTTYSTVAVIKKGSSETVNIGRPIANTQTYILDRYRQPVPVGIAGELYIGGEGLARGYLTDPN